MKIRKPTLDDGQLIWCLAKESQVLDLNSAYCYLLQCRDFSEMCAVAEDGDGLVGFVTGYRPPHQASIWFVWQIGVAARARGQGVAKRLLMDVLGRHDHLDRVEATISPGNQASRALFASLARELKAPLQESSGFEARLFPGGHDPEPRITIGPFALTQRERACAELTQKRLNEVRP